MDDRWFEQPMKLHGTILEVNLRKPILPKSKVNFELVFEAQVPIQIRRSGRDNAQGIRYSMSQWYPKMCKYKYYEGYYVLLHLVCGRTFTVFGAIMMLL